MNIQITNQDKYSNVIKVRNFDAKLVADNRADGHISIAYRENGKEYTLDSFGIKTNEDLENDYGFRFVSHEDDIDNNKYYF